MKKLILTIAVALSSLTLVAQSVEVNEPTVEYNLNTGLYLVRTDSGNWHHVSEDGTLNGPFKFTANNITIKGYMRDGKRHGKFTHLIDGDKFTEAVYEDGIVIKYVQYLNFKNRVSIETNLASE